MPSYWLFDCVPHITPKNIRIMLGILRMVQGKFPSLLFPIEVKNIARGKHGSDSDAYDNEGSTLLMMGKRPCLPWVPFLRTNLNLLLYWKISLQIEMLAMEVLVETRVQMRLTGKDSEGHISLRISN